MGDAGAFVALLPINLFFPDLLKPRFAFSIAFVAGQTFQIFGQPLPTLAHPADGKGSSPLLAYIHHYGEHSSVQYCGTLVSK